LNIRITLPSFVPLFNSCDLNHWDSEIGDVSKNGFAQGNPFILGNRPVYYCV